MDTRLVPLFRRLAQAALVLSLCFFTFPAAQSQQHYEATLDSLNQHPLQDQPRESVGLAEQRSDIQHASADLPNGQPQILRGGPFVR